MSEETSQTSQSAAFDPFSLEQAYKTYQNNIRKSDQLIYDITKGARGNVSEHDLLLMAVEAIARMTDNTAILSVITEALEARSAKSAESFVSEDADQNQGTKEEPGT